MRSKDPQDLLPPQFRKDGYRVVTLEDQVEFTCDPSCWGTCCRAITIRLSPFDVWEMARGLGKSCAEFIRDHCRLTPGANSKWPIVYLADAQDGPCEFLRPDGGCGIRAHRPAVCRSSPMGRFFFSDKDEETGEWAGQTEHLLFVLPHPQCQKKNTSPPQLITVADLLGGENDVRTWWNGSDAAFDLLNWAHNELKYPEWATDSTAKIISTFLYSPDLVCPPGTERDDALGRGIEAVRYYLLRAAAWHGYGPLLDPEDPPATLAGAIAIMRTGAATEESMADIQTKAKSLYKGYTVVEQKKGKLDRLFEAGSFEAPEDLRATYRFLKRAKDRRQNMVGWGVVVNDNFGLMPATEFMRLFEADRRKPS